MKKYLHICLVFIGFIFMYTPKALAQWYSATLTPGRWAMGITSVGSKAIFAGGYYTPNMFVVPSAQVDLFDAAANQWTKATLSQPRHSIGVATVGDLAFFAGGQSALSYFESTVYNRVDIYNAATDEWTTSSLSQRRANIAATAVGDKVVFAGGTTDIGTTNPDVASRTVDIYNTTTNQWSVTQLPGLSNLIKATRVEDKVLYTTGNQAFVISRINIYNTTTGQWSTATLPLTRQRIAISSLGPLVFFAGGTSNDTESNRVDIYNSATSQWSTAQLSQARADIAAISLDTKILFAGGSNNSNVVDIYDAMTGQWTAAQLSVGRSAVAMTQVGSKVFLAGGNSQGTVDIYDDASGVWSTSQLPNLKTNVYGFTLGELALFTERTITVNGVNSSGFVDIYTTNSALPVNLISFSGQWTENVGAKLSWQTSLETNNDRFEIQRSADAKSFETIGRVQGKGNANERTDYSFVDTDMPAGINYYRLKQVDLDGSVQFSKTISVSRQADKQPVQLSVWSSSATGLLTLELSAGATIQKTNIYDLHGRQITTQTGPYTTANVSSLQTGVYVVDVTTSDGQHLRSRFVKQ